jgi:hypothetical protein
VTFEGTPAQRRLAASVWRFRWSAELEAAARFSRLARELAAVDAVERVVTLARHAARDELRHAELCANLVEWLGGAPVPREKPAPRWARPASPAGLSARDAVLYEVVAMSCITETLSAALLGEMVLTSRDAHLKKTMRDILRDEIGHARLGWAHLAAEQQRGSTEFLGEYLPAMLAGTIDEEVFSSGPEHVEQAGVSGLGSLVRAERRRVFEETMRRVAFPGLRRYGVDTRRGEEWLADPRWRRAG